MQSCIKTIPKIAILHRLPDNWRQSVIVALFFAFEYTDNFGINRGLTNKIIQLVCHKIIIISAHFYDGCGRLLLFHIGIIY